jgi:hypothetical protein
MTSTPDPSLAQASGANVPRDGLRAVERLAAQRLSPVLGGLLIFALWLIARPYRGARHDGVLYLGQTLARLFPDTIGRDLFLAYGSQDRYSLFSASMSPLVRAMGVPMSQAIPLIVCQAVFVIACWHLTTDLPSRFLRWGALLSLAALSHTYTGGGGAFGFTEPFLSARSVAEPLALLSLALLLRRRMAWAAFAMACATAMHALIALPVLLVAWVMLSLEDRRWWRALAVVVAAALAGALGVTPFDGLWRRYDPAWWAIVCATNSNVFIGATQVQDWGTAAFDVVVLFLCMRLLAGTALVRLLRAMLVCAPVLAAIWAMGADLLHDVLLTQLQVWRIFWLTHLFALLLLPLPLLHYWRAGPVGRWAAAAFTLTAVAVSANLSTAPLCLLWALAPLMVLKFQARVSAWLARLGTVVSGVAMMIVSATVGWQTRSAVTTFPDRFNGTSDLQIILGLSVVVAAVGVLLMLGLASTGPRRWLSGIALLGLLACGVACWDQRSDWQRFTEGGLREEGAPFAGMVPAAATVYWDGSLIEPWLLMRRPQFFESQQGSGLLFARAAAIEFAARQRAMSPLMVQQQVCQSVANAMGGGPEDCAPPLEVIRDICRGEPRHPDYLVFRVNPRDGANGASATWTFRPGDPVRSRTYRLYDCASQR